MIRPATPQPATGCSAEGATYEPSEDSIVLPLGPRGGVSYAPEVGVLGAPVTSDIKGNLYLDLYRDLLGVATAS